MAHTCATQKYALHLAGHRARLRHQHRLGGYRERYRRLGRHDCYERGWNERVAQCNVDTRAGCTVRRRGASRRHQLATRDWSHVVAVWRVSPNWWRTILSHRTHVYPNHKHQKGDDIAKLKDVSATERVTPTQRCINAKDECEITVEVKNLQINSFLQCQKNQESVWS